MELCHCHGCIFCVVGKGLHSTRPTNRPLVKGMQAKLRVYFAAFHLIVTRASVSTWLSRAATSGTDIWPLRPSGLCWDWKRLKATTRLTHPSNPNGTGLDLRPPFQHCNVHSKTTKASSFTHHVTQSVCSPNVVFMVGKTFSKPLELCMFWFGVLCPVILQTPILHSKINLLIRQDHR